MQVIPLASLVWIKKNWVLFFKNTFSLALGGEKLLKRNNNASKNYLYPARKVPD
jgi:hypothetical protein